MSKSRFVEFDEFKKELSSIHRDIDNLYENTETLEEWHNSVKDAINHNADNGKELEKRVNELASRIDKVARGVRVAQDMAAQKSSGTGLFVGIGAIASLFGFIYLLGEINDLAKQIDMLESKAKRGEFKGAQPVKDTPAEVTFREDGSYRSGNN